VEVVIERAVERVIAAMRDNLGEQLTVDDMARTAMFSKFHFTRIFRRATGVSPGRFLSAMRLQRAKQLLVSTTMNVADISVQVGYNSVGTFSSRFTRSVGLAPTAYRRLGGFAPHIGAGGEPRASSAACVSGRILMPPDARGGLIFVGLFRERVPEGRPAQCAILPGPGPFVLNKVPRGSWYLLAHSIAGDPEHLAQLPFPAATAVSVGTLGPILVKDDQIIADVDLCLSPMRTLDPPVLLALMDVRRLAVRSLDAVRRPAWALPLDG